VVALSLLEQVALPVELSLAVVEPLLAAREVAELGVDRLLLGYHALLDADDLAASLQELGFELGGGGRGPGTGGVGAPGRRVARVQRGSRHEPRRHERCRDHDFHAVPLHRLWRQPGRWLLTAASEPAP
jgi:hypothetical protein